MNHVAPIKLWLPTLEIEANIKVSKLDLIFISGNQFKHNLSRLTGVSKNIHSILISSGYDVPIEQIPLALEDFREHLQENYFMYYGTWLSELLNNLNLGIQNYLLPTYENSCTSNNFNYDYEYPCNIRNEIPRQYFWQLMNSVGTKPYFEKFSGARYLKHQSSIE